MAQLTIPNNITAGTEITAAPLQNNFTAISTWANGGVGNANIENLAVSSSKIADKAVTAAKIADNAISNAKLAVKIARGNKTFSVVGAPVDSFIEVLVPFPLGTFSAPPTVVVSWGGYADTSSGHSDVNPIVINSGSVIKDGFTAIYKVDASGNQYSKNFNWIAVGV